MDLISESNCAIPNQRTTGKCIPEKYCSTYGNLMDAKPLTSERLNFILRLQCDVDRICCPNVNDFYRYVKRFYLLIVQWPLRIPFNQFFLKKLLLRNLINYAAVNSNVLDFDAYSNFN